MNQEWIFCHRGVWKTLNDQNSVESFNLAAELGFSSEIDLRISSNQIYVSHDPRTNVQELELENYNLTNSRYAMNIKSDGIFHLFKDMRNILEMKNSFVFDGSIPEMFQYKKSGIPHALRLSEYEHELPWETKYVWVDGFHSDWWINNDDFSKYLEKYQVVIVSPEIHGRSYLKTWEWFIEKRQKGYDNLNICTDKPVELSAISGAQ